MLVWLDNLPPLTGFTLFALIAMTVGSVYRLMTLGSLPPAKAHDRKASLKTWWIILILVLSACWLGRYGVVILLAVASGLGIDEFLRLTAPMVPPAPRRRWAIMMVLVGYGSLALLGDTSFQVLIPVVAIWSLVLPHVLGDSTQAYLTHVGFSLWGVMVVVWGVAHAAWLPFRSDLPHGPVGPTGWFLLLVLLTEMNDIFQALVGRAVGRHKILPRISPNKTWEGFVGGVVLTVACTMLLSLWLTPDLWHTSPQSLLSGVWGWLGPVLAGLVIAISGFVGDLNMSCAKRDVGVKDGSQMLPGQGGVIDRIDSLSFTAPAFSLFVSVWLK